MAGSELCGVQVDVCQSCAGVWFDEGELGKVVAQGDSTHFQEFTAMDRPKGTEASHLSRRCPKCGDVLTSYHYQYTSPIILDCCDDCGGIFVDPGELQEIDAYKNQSEQPNPKAEAAVLVSELDKKTHQARERAYWFARVVGLRRAIGGSSWWA